MTAMPSHAAGSSPHTQTVLVVEDQQALLVLTKRLLERQGYTVLVAGGADEARRVFDAHPSIDVVVTDVVMPGRSGTDLILELVALRPGLKVVYMSGYPDAGLVEDGVLMPGIAYLSKPFTAESLAAKLHEVLSSGAHESVA